MASEKQEWPSDPEWRKFAARIADGVTVAINSGITIALPTCEAMCCCPLGCVARDRYPTPGMVRQELGVDMVWAVGFVRGFENRALPNDHWPSVKLGRAYRRRFIDKEST